MPIKTRVRTSICVCVDKFYECCEDILSGPHSGTNPPKTVCGLMLESVTGMRERGGVGGGGGVLR